MTSLETGQLGVHWSTRIKNQFGHCCRSIRLNTQNYILLPSALPMDAADAAAGTPISTLRRRNSIETPSDLTLHTEQHHPYSSSSSSSTATTITTTTSSSSSSSSSDFELVSLKPASYTSLRDILPSTAAFVQSPKVPSFAVHSGYEISIRNRLVKQAAWAYLQPMSTSPGSGGSTVFQRLWNRFSDAFLGLITGICECFLRSIHVTTTSSRL